MTYLRNIAIIINGRRDLIEWACSASTRKYSSISNRVVQHAGGLPRNANSPERKENVEDLFTNKVSGLRFTYNLQDRRRHTGR